MHLITKTNRRHEDQCCFCSHHYSQAMYFLRLNTFIDTFCLKHNADKFLNINYASRRNLTTFRTPYLWPFVCFMVFCLFGWVFKLEMYFYVKETCSRHFTWMQISQFSFTMIGVARSKYFKGFFRLVKSIFN